MTVHKDIPYLELKWKIMNDDNPQNHIIKNKYNKAGYYDVQ